MKRNYEYKFVRLGEGWLSVRKEARDGYQEQVIIFVSRTAWETHRGTATRWQAVELAGDGGTFRGEIPAGYTHTRFPLQYYFEIQTGPAEATLCPQLAPDLANVPYHVVRCAA